MKDVKEDFPLLMHNRNMIYFDSACTSLKPSQVIEAESSYYKEFGACAGRSSHSLGRKTNERLEEARRIVSKFVGADSEGLIWTRNTTESLNLLANSLDFSKKRKVITTIMEHHAVLLPFMKLRDKGIIELQILDCNGYGEVEMETWENEIDERTSLIVTNNGNNTTGYKNKAKEICSLAHDYGARICIDGAQGVPHHKTHFKKDDFDFLCFSAHKMLGPTGVGAFVSKLDALEGMDTYIMGGGIVKNLNIEKIEYMDKHRRFEAGIQDYGGILGFAEACRYLDDFGMENVENYEKELGKKLTNALQEADVKIYGHPDDNYSALRSFNFENGKPHEVALMMDKEDIALRSGFFCAQPAVERLGAPGGAVRASCYIYNTNEEIEKFGEILQKLKFLYS